MAATWGGAPSIKGPTDSVRMILLTIWLVVALANTSLDQMEGHTNISKPNWCSISMER
jgi:hypothetical protein